MVRFPNIGSTKQSNTHTHYRFHKNKAIHTHTAEGEDPDTPGYLRWDRVRLGQVLGS